MYKLLQPDSLIITLIAPWNAVSGDRGFLHPELTHSATSEEVKELEGRHFDEYLSSNRTCEVGMNLATGQDYRSVIFLLEELTR